MVDPNVVEQVLHNHTVNLTGGLDHNIAMDRVCEFMSTDSKVRHYSFNDATEFLF